jgi:hypothetical protein
MKAVLILAAVLLLGVVAASSHFAGRSAVVENTPVAAANTIPPIDVSAGLSQSDEAGPEVKLILLALRPEGFDSREMQLDAGDHLFIISNRTGLKEVNIRLEREGKERVAAVKMHGRRMDWKQRLKFKPGTYLITADDNPEWTCRIMVGP